MHILSFCLLALSFLSACSPNEDVFKKMRCPDRMAFYGSNKQCMCSWDYPIPYGDDVFIEKYGSACISVDEFITTYGEEFTEPLPLCNQIVAHVFDPPYSKDNPSGLSEQERKDYIRCIARFAKKLEDCNELWLEGYRIDCLVSFAKTRADCEVFDEEPKVYARCTQFHPD